jgi:hypothetical protein
MNVTAQTDIGVWGEDLYWSTPGYREAEWDVTVAVVVAEVWDAHLGQQLCWPYGEVGL